MLHNMEIMKNYSAKTKDLYSSSYLGKENMVPTQDSSRG